MTRLYGYSSRTRASSDQPKHADEDTLVMTLMAALRISKSAAARSSSVIVMTDNFDRLIREMSIAAHCGGATRVHGVAKGIAQCGAINQALSVCRHMANAARVVRLLIASF